MYFNIFCHILRTITSIVVQFGRPLAKTMPFILGSKPLPWLPNNSCYHGNNFFKYFFGSIFQKYLENLQSSCIQVFIQQGSQCFLCNKMFVLPQLQFTNNLKIKPDVHHGVLNCFKQKWPLLVCIYIICHNLRTITPIIVKFGRLLAKTMSFILSQTITMVT